MVSRLNSNSTSPSVTRPTTPSTSPVRPQATSPSARPDPLAVTDARGTTFNRVDSRSMTELQAQALKLGADVPGRVQDGPTCGLYALGMVMDFWEKKNPANTLPLVQNSDVVRWDSHSMQPDTQKRLFDVAKEKGFTTQGEMFYADQLGELAKSFGYQTKVTDAFTLADLHAVLDKKHPALVAFDVDQVGNPGMFGGKRAHWAVVEGHFQKDGVEYLVATHGWTGKEYVWKAEDLMKSIAQLNASDFPAAPKDITGTLKGKLVEVIGRG